MEFSSVDQDGSLFTAESRCNLKIAKLFVLLISEFHHLNPQSRKNYYYKFHVIPIVDRDFLDGMLQTSIFHPS